MRLFHFLHKRCGRQHGYATHWYLRRIGKKLQLDAMQQARLLALHHAIETSRAYLAEIHEDRHELLDKVFSDQGFDRDSALHYLNVPRLAFEEQAPVIIESLKEFYQCLNPPQREQLRSLLHKQQQQHQRCWH
jgi:hypothetical protein